MSTSSSRATRREAAGILRRILDALPLPATVAAYLRGHADALDAKQPRRRHR